MLTSNTQILIVDDESDVRAVLIEAVKQLGGIPLEASKATDAMVN